MRRSSLMINNQNSQEKLLTMLTEIYDQLEELETVLEGSLADLRSNLHQQHSINLEKSEGKLTAIENSYREQALNLKGRERIQNSTQALKLELGF